MNEADYRKMFDNNLWYLGGYDDTKVLNYDSSLDLMQLRTQLTEDGCTASQIQNYIEGVVDSVAGKEQNYLDAQSADEEMWQIILGMSKHTFPITLRDGRMVTR